MQGNIAKKKKKKKKKKIKITILIVCFRLEVGQIRNLFFT